VTPFLQILGSVAGFMDKAKTHFEKNGVELGEIVETSLYPDMLPFRFQIGSVAHHSQGAIDGVKAGLFSPPGGGAELDYAGLQKRVGDARAALEALDPATVNGWAGKDMVFKLGERSLPFTAEDFLTSFSTPNFYFHATTAYDILRSKGVPLGKRDFLGQMRMKR
jgi:hypothetical protein